MEKVKCANKKFVCGSKIYHIVKYARTNSKGEEETVIEVRCHKCEIVMYGYVETKKNTMIDNIAKQVGPQST